MVVEEDDDDEKTGKTGGSTRATSMKVISLYAETKFLSVILQPTLIDVVSYFNEDSRPVIEDD